MCGLAAWLRFHAPVGCWRGCPELILPEGALDLAAFEAAAASLPRRGPDASGAEDIALGAPPPPPPPSGGGAAAADAGVAVADLHLRASVLHLRGAAAAPQPVATSAGGRLLFNGEIYAVLPPPEAAAGGRAGDGSGPASSGASSSLGEGELPAGVSDTMWLERRVAECEERAGGDRWEPLAEQLRDLLERLHGPFAIAVWCPRRRALLFGRDKLGRRSLVVGRSQTGDLCISSVPASPVDLWNELPVTGLFALDLSDLARPALHHIPWREAMYFEQPWWWSAMSLPAPLSEGSAASPLFAEVLSAAVARRVRGVAGGSRNAPRVGLLFSGGLDSTVLAALAAEALPSGEVVELLNVAFDRAAPDRLTALCSFADLVARYGGDRFRLILADVEEAEVRRNEACICRLLGPEATHLDFNIAAALWFAAKGKGLVCRTDFSQEPWWAAVMSNPANLSGCCLEEQQQRRPARPDPPLAERARCASCVLPSKPGCVHGACKLCCRKAQDRLGPSPPRCPVHKPPKDARPTAAEPAEPGAAEAQDDGEPPALDLSAARLTRDGGAAGTAPPEATTATSRVLLVGTGADELLGGYGRHRTARAKRGVEGVQGEMLKDLQRLWRRNLGRDDRVVADHGREARHPFLDDAVLRFVGSLPMELLAFGPGGEAAPGPDKWMLRELAAARGLSACARFKKRAIQFGSRIAKQSNVWHTGSNRQGKGTMVYRALDPTAASREEEP